MKVYLYSRVSTAEQSLDQQERTAMEWLKLHNMQVDEVISDEGVSGKIPYKERSLGKVIIPKIKAGDLLIVSEISRLGRSMADLSLLVNTDLKERRVRLVIASMGIDLDCNKMTAIDQLILSNFAFAGQLERELTSSRTQSALDVRKSLIAEKGGFMSKAGNWTTVLGRKKGTKCKPEWKQHSEYLSEAYKEKISSDNNRYKQWLQMHEMRARGETLAKIAETMNALAQRAPKGGLWSGPVVLYALRTWGKYFIKDLDKTKR